LKKKGWRTLLKANETKIGRAVEGGQKQEEYDVQKVTTEKGEGQAGVWRDGLEAAIRERVREVIEEILHEEVEEAMGARRSQRAAGRCGYRHGRKARRLTLRAGTGQMAVPRARLVNCDGDEGEWQSQQLPRYRRSSPEVEQAVLGVYLSGNTRRIRGGR
jgi:transposase-like protein